MMNDERLTQDAAALFDEVEKWHAFLELTEMQDAIVEHWLARATQELRSHSVYLPPEWAIASWGSDTDTKWYLPEFGEESVVFGFWDYEFTLSIDDQVAFDIELARRRLSEPACSSLRTLFSEFKDPKNPEVIAYKPSGMFRFGKSRDGHLSWEELAWYAGHRTEEFVEQAVHQVERITKSAEITAQMRELNESARIKLD